MIFLVLFASTQLPIFIIVSWTDVKYYECIPSFLLDAWVCVCILRQETDPARCHSGFLEETWPRLLRHIAEPQVHPNLQVSIYFPRWQLDHHVDHHLDHHQHDQHDPHLAHGDVEGSLRLPEARGNVHAVDVAVVGKLEMMMVVIVVMMLTHMNWI